MLTHCLHFRSAVPLNTVILYLQCRNTPVGQIFFISRYKSQKQENLVNVWMRTTFKKLLMKIQVLVKETEKTMYKNRGDKIFLLTDSIRHRASLERLSGHLLSFSRICQFGISKKKFFRFRFFKGKWQKLDHKQKASVRKTTSQKRKSVPNIFYAAHNSDSCRLPSNISIEKYTLSSDGDALPYPLHTLLLLTDYQSLSTHKLKTHDSMKKWLNRALIRFCY